MPSEEDLRKLTSTELEKLLADAAQILEEREWAREKRRSAVRAGKGDPGPRCRS